MHQKAIKLIYNNCADIIYPIHYCKKISGINSRIVKMSDYSKSEEISATCETPVSDSGTLHLLKNDENSSPSEFKSSLASDSNNEISSDVSNDDVENSNICNSNADDVKNNVEDSNSKLEPNDCSQNDVNDNLEDLDSKLESNDCSHDDVNDNAEDSKLESNDCRHDDVNDNAEDSDSKFESNDCSHDDSCEREEIKNQETNFFEDKRNEYELVLAQCRDKLESLGKDNINLRHEVYELKIKLNHQEVESKKQEAKIKAELLANIEKLSRECNNLHKEKEAIVIRYANSEKDVITEKKIKQELEKKIKDMNKDRENLLLKLKNALSENTKLSSNVENKMIEIAKLQKENEKLNADFNSREIRIKWLQNKLKTESNAHQETQAKLEHTLHRLNEMREEAEQVRKDCQEMIKCYQEAEEIKSVKLDGQLKQKLTELEVQKQEKCDQEQVYILLRQELDALKKKQRLTMEDNNALTLKINSLEKERLEYEQTLCKLKDIQNSLKEEIADLTSQLAEMEGLKLQLEQEREKSAASLREVERLRLTNAELQSDLDACHVKEGDRLDFVEKLTAKTMLLQSDHCLLEVKAQALENEVNQLKKSLSEVEQNYAKLLLEHENSRKENENEMQLLVQKLAEKAKSVEKLNTCLEESENENRVLKKRHIASIKELSRELYQCKRRLEMHETNCGLRAESVSLGSRTSSSASLHISNSNDMCQNASPSVTFSGKRNTPNHERKNGTPENQFVVDKEVLIEKIINLQKTLAQRNDKILFLEDHIEHLVKEMRKKSKLVDFKNV